MYIILSTRTYGSSYQATFLHLKDRFSCWDHIRQHNLPELERLLLPGGLGTLKAGQILGIVSQLRGSFDIATLEPLREMSTEDAEKFLISLPGVAKKTAKCVLMYALDRDVLPVDVHTHRVAMRLGFKVKKRPDTSQDLIEDAIPPPLRYGFHTNAIAHGRAVCRPTNPLCEECCISQWCDYYQAQKSNMANSS